MNKKISFSEYGSVNKNLKADENDNIKYNNNALIVVQFARNVKYCYCTKMFCRKVKEAANETTGSLFDKRAEYGSYGKCVIKCVIKKADGGIRIL